MKRKHILTLLLLLAIQYAKADEGMWLPYLLGPKVYENMVKKGLRLTKEQLYSINQPSVKDAVLLFGGGCTGEVVSSEGLVFTNHHCGYGAIAGISSAAHNYLKNGFYASSRQEEIPVDLSVQFLIKVEDVTTTVQQQLEPLTAAQRRSQEPGIMKAIVTKAVAGAGYEARVLPFFGGRQYLLFVYERYKDIRLVGTPQETLGHFGGLVDNWEWPRHAADFAIFRIYAGKDGKPAAYSRDNVPLKPKYFLPVSLKGVRENDYVMIMGYPLNTSRYKSSYAARMKAEVEDRAVASMYGIRLRYMQERMMQDSLLSLKLAPSFAGMANQKKFLEGEASQIGNPGLTQKYQVQEKMFDKWAQQQAAYRQVLGDYASLYEQWSPVIRHRIYIIDGICGTTLTDFAASLQQLADVLDNPRTTPETVKRAMGMAGRARKQFIERDDRMIDRLVMTAVCRRFYTDIPATQHPPGLYEGIRERFGSLDKEHTYNAWTDSLIGSTMILNDEKWERFMNNPDPATLHADPVFAYVSAFRNNYIAKYLSRDDSLRAKAEELDQAYMSGLMNMQPDRNWYPDANFSMRLTYGAVRSYKPRDAVSYDYLTTMKGAVDKYTPGDINFDLPQAYIDLYSRKDFGKYKDPARNDVVTCFIADTDITAGNSGSPVLNAQGQLVGIAFDNNYESMCHKLLFDQQMNRTICVDIRYVLWCIDKLAGAPNIVNELKLVR